jgi:hypothetical protein
MLLLQAGVENVRVWLTPGRPVICSRASDAPATDDNKVCIPSRDVCVYFRQYSVEGTLNTVPLLLQTPRPQARSLATEAIANDCLPWCCFEDLTRATTDVTDPLCHQDY